MEDKCKCIEEITTLEEVQVMSISGTSDYAELTNKPQINGHELEAGDNTLETLGIQPKGDYITQETADGKYATKGEIPDTKDFITENAVDTKLEDYYTKQDIDGKGYLTEHQDISNLATKNELNLKADKTALSGYATTEDIADFIKKDVKSLDNFYDKQTIDSKTENFITKAVDDLNNYYLKTETYNQSEIDQKISTVVSGGFKKVDQLPESGESKYIYLVPAEKSFSQNIKNEFIWLEDEQAFEQIGSTQLDLEPYVTTEALNQKLQEYVSNTTLEQKLADYYKKTETYSNTEVDDKVDEETRDLLKTLSRELKSDEENGGFSSQTTVSVKNKSGATELIMEIDNLDITTDVPTNSVLGTLKGQDLEDRLKALEEGEGTGGDVPIYYFDGDKTSEANKTMFSEIIGLILENKPFLLQARLDNKDFIINGMRNRTDGTYIQLFGSYTETDSSSVSSMQYFKEYIVSIEITADAERNVSNISTSITAGTSIASNSINKLSTKQYVDDAITTAVTGALEGEY